MTTSAAVLGPLPLERRPGFAGLSLPITLFSIPLGLAGLGAAWTAADVLGAPQVPLDLRHPLTGPLTAYIPVIAMLLVPHYVSGLGTAGRLLTFLALGGLTLNAAALVAHPEIAGQPFLSPRTVEWHLTRVYGKLVITARRELRGAVPAVATARA